VLAIVLLAGMAWALSTPTAAHLLNDNRFDGVIVAAWAFLVGGIWGFFGYYAIGAVLDQVVKALGSHGTYRRSRHVLAFSAVPLVVSLLAWPVKLAAFGGDAFRSGGADAGVDGAAFVGIEIVFLAWAIGLLVVGVRAVHGWTWRRAVAAVALAAAGCGAAVVAVYLAAGGL
jgi:hypothetical protein